MKYIDKIFLDEYFQEFPLLEIGQKIYIQKSIKQTTDITLFFY